jgi:hypothetical protein
MVEKETFALMANNEVETERVAAGVERLALKILKRDVNGILPVGTKINGDRLEKLKPYELASNGPDEIEVTEIDRSARKYMNFAAREFDKNPDLAKNHVVVVTPIEEKTKMTIHYWQDKVQVNTRGNISPAYVSFVFEDDTNGGFISQIREAPDMVEEIYQETFQGLDSKNGSPGMRRLEVDGFYLVIPENSQIFEGVCDDLMRSEISLENNPLEVRRYEYGPYGTSRKKLQEKNADQNIVIFTKLPQGNGCNDDQLAFCAGSDF